MARSEKSRKALLAAWTWVGAYEASTTLESAFEELKTPAKVKATYPDFPEDMVDAYSTLRRMLA